MVKGKYSAKSFHNIIILVIFAIGLFVVYRYVKNLEHELKISNSNIHELNSKYTSLNDIVSNTLNITENISNNANMNTKTHLHKEDIDKNDDNDSINSSDITDMLKKVMIHDLNSEDDLVNNIMNMINDEEQEYIKENIQVVEIAEQQDTKTYIEEVAVHDDQIQEETRIISDEQEDNCEIFKEININEPKITVNVGEMNEKSLMLKTNEQLKAMLKIKNLSTKGQKSELVKRLLEN
jgi:hypothetical protein